MNQKRMLHTSIWASGQFSKLSQNARLTYIGTISLGDDDGRLKGSPSLIKSQLYPYDNDIKTSDVDGWLLEIISQKLLVKYQVDGEEYLFHPKWESYQHIREDRRKDSNIPSPLFEFESVATKRQPNVNQKTTSRQHSIDKVSITKGSIDTNEQDQAFVAFWDKYPRKIGKKMAWKAWGKIKYTQELGKTILDSLEKASKSDQWTKNDGRYIPHAATWLNGERWEDEITPIIKKNPKYDNINTKTIRS